MHDVGKLHNIPADVKEKLHHLPPGYTRASFLDDTTRHRMLANGWHWGVARRLLAILLVLTSGHHGGSRQPRTGAQRHQMHGGTVRRGTGADGTTTPPEAGSRLAEGRPPGALEHVGRHHPLHGRPAARRTGARESADPVEHWRHDICRIRRLVLEEVRQMVDDAPEDTAAWLAARSALVRATYTTPGKARPTQIPLLLHLLETIAGMKEDLREGFEMIGEIRRKKPG